MHLLACIFLPAVALLGAPQDSDPPLDPVSQMILDAPSDLLKGDSGVQTYWLGRFASEFENDSLAPEIRGKIGSTLAQWYYQLGQTDAALSSWRSVLSLPRLSNPVQYEALTGVASSLKASNAPDEEIQAAQAQIQGFLDSGWNSGGGVDQVLLGQARHDLYMNLAKVELDRNNAGLAANYRLMALDTGQKDASLSVAYDDIARLFLLGGLGQLASEYFARASAAADSEGSPNFQFSKESIYARYGLFQINERDGLRKITFGDGDSPPASSLFYPDAEALLHKFAQSKEADDFEKLLAFHCVESGAYERAVAHYRKLLEKAPENQDLWLGLIRAVSRMGDKSAEYDVYKEATRALGSSFLRDEMVRRNIGHIEYRLHITAAQSLIGLDPASPSVPISAKPTSPESPAQDTRARAWWGAGIILATGVFVALVLGRRGVRAPS